MANLLNTICSESTLINAWNHVKSKGSGGGIDGMFISDFEKDKQRQIPIIAEELKKGTWKPLPYVEIEVAKNKNPDEFRKLGLTSIRDKVVQQSIRSVIEPKLEKLFLGCSYGYRPGKGAVKAIKRVLQECNRKKSKFVLRLDIDNFFDSINHELLQKRIIAVIPDMEVVRLIMLCVEMGKVRKNTLEWIETSYGTPQGAVLSPILSNLYLHSFDQFAVSRNVPYIRYADDFLFLSESKEQAEDISQKTENYLKDKLFLSLNKPIIINQIEDGFEFLGVTITKGKVSISEKKHEDLTRRIEGLVFSKDGLSVKSSKTWSGISNYYGMLLPQQDLEYFDSVLQKHLSNVVCQNIKEFPKKSDLFFALSTFTFLSQKYKSTCKQVIAEIISEYLNEKQKDNIAINEKKNQSIIQKRKQEYRKKETEMSGLLVNKPGVFVGLNKQGVTISQKGKTISTNLPDNLSQIVITGQGVSMSSNLIGFCMKRRIPIDFFDSQGTHLGSILSSKLMQTSLWSLQANADIKLRNSLALSIISGKIRNQLALVKYYNKYHKNHYPELKPKLEQINNNVNNFKIWKNEAKIKDDDFIQKLVGHEAQVAISYWAYIRELFTDDKVNFEQREHQGAQDLVNSMLNYGYAILYVRVWQALLAAHLNPFDSLIHAKREGKPTLVYDMVEIFRSQVVDRVVISLIQKGHELMVRNGLLTDNTRQILVKSVMDRLSRYEKYQGKEIKMEQIIQQQAKALALAFERKEKFKPYVAKW